MAIALVTGTSSGIGLATAVTLARGGHKVIATMRNVDRGDELRKIVLAETLPVTVTALNVDNDGSVSDTVDRVLVENGRIDILVNNAGVGGRGSVEEAPMEVFRQVMETNFFGGLRCIKAVIPSMRERRSGCIVNVSSVAGRIAAALGPYAASKWAFEALSESLAQEMKGPFNSEVQRGDFWR
jgi:NAD(P)-dependent dehydrogenase (short-subunit alcohol dehydrogenase family)